MVFIRENLESNQKHILSLVKMESSYMNSQHYEFKNNKYLSLDSFHILSIELTTLTFDSLILKTKWTSGCSGRTNIDDQ